MSGQATDASLPDLVRLLADDAKELVRAEVGLAKDELGKTLRSLLIVIAGCTAATVVAVLALCAYVSAAVLAAGGSAALAVAAGASWGALVVLAAVAVGARMLGRSEPVSSPAATATDNTTTTHEVLR
jgi:hypothetical protein